MGQENGDSRVKKNKNRDKRGEEGNFQTKRRQGKAFKGGGNEARKYSPWRSANGGKAKGQKKQKSKKTKGDSYTPIEEILANSKGRVANEKR